MNYFELINKCLVELNYKEVNSYKELIKNEHKKIKNIINIINTEVCRAEKWDFLLEKTEFVLPKNTGEITNTINGRIALVLIDNVIYKYYENFEKFLTNTQPSETYSSFNDKLLFPIFDRDKTITIIYYSENNVVDIDGNKKLYFENETDKTVIPEIYAEPILIYGTCMRLKGNAQHIKFSYWMSMYKDALMNLKSKSHIDANVTPTIKLYRYWQKKQEVFSFPLLRFTLAEI